MSDRFWQLFDLIVGVIASILTILVFSWAFSPLAQAQVEPTRLLVPYEQVPTQYISLHCYANIPWCLVEIDPSIALDGVEDVPLDPQLAESLPRIQAPQAHAGGHTGVGELIAVIDWGMQCSHTELTGRCAAEACFSTTTPFNFRSLCPSSQDVEIGPGAGAPCTLPNTTACGHGTHVAHTAAEVAPGAGLIAIQAGTRDIRRADPLMLTSDLLEALDWLATQYPGGLAAINISAGSFSVTQVPCSSDPFVQPVQAFVNLFEGRNTPLVFGVGNRGVTGVAKPGCAEKAVVAEASLDTSDVVWSSSNLAPTGVGFRALAAPGCTITAAEPAGYGDRCGTSMAAPHLAGSLAVLQGASGWPMPVNQSYAILRNTGAPVVGSSSPRIDLAAAVDAVTGVGADADSDGVGDLADNCTAVVNANQRDTSRDGYGNICDPDVDGNGAVSFFDLGMVRWAIAYGLTSQPYPQAYPDLTGDGQKDEADKAQLLLDADFDGDGDVDAADRNVVGLYMFGPPGPSAITP